jgi:hypothetical protein
MKSTISARAARAMTLLFIRSAASCARQSPTVMSSGREAGAHSRAPGASPWQPRSASWIGRPSGGLPGPSHEMFSETLSQFDTYLTTPAFGNALPAYRSMSCKARSARSAAAFGTGFLRSTRIPSLAYWERIVPSCSTSIRNAK